MLKLTNTIIFWLSLVLLLPSFWFRNQLPESINLGSDLQYEPEQKKIQQRSFSVTYDKHKYQVNPQYSYDLHGLVVSFNHHSGDMGLHKRWKDHINAADICVVWGKTAQSPFLNDITFWNGEFTCNFKTKSNKAWSAFNRIEISNNHLITTEDSVRKTIKKIRVGDQIHIKGSLSSYVFENGSERGTSITRTDTGNGACETIYVNQFEITQAGNNHWRTTLYFSLEMLLLSILIHFIRPYHPYS